MKPSHMNPNETSAPANRFLLWSCMWGGGLAWLLHFLAIWICAEFGCLGGWGVAGPLEISRVAWLVLTVSGVCLALAGLASYASWHWCSRNSDSGIEAFVARYGTVANPVFMLVIAVQTLPVFFHLRDCGSAIG